ncbi:NitT/TauT family transport system permease protein [Clostridium sp. DSM 8431]|uniref:ABC transporter permease n=1 Tax=Clostridium sp. DSM 8431 TaxID=1761781 RepID=UPI0008F0785C|nr:ABC transporter permease subunit [Clostridium sp. DSM 8431]SFU41050.1 NitT/TauT family transport system permease protein [Clostridium sp. DSM 8431]
MREYSWKNKKWEILSLIFFLAIWRILSIKVNNDIYIPKIEEVIKSISTIIKEKNFGLNFSNSLIRTIISFLTAYILAVILGVLSLIYPVFQILFKPVNSIGKTIPTMVLVLLALIWFDKDKTPFIVGFAIVFPILYEGAISAVSNADKELLEMCSIYNVSKIQKIKKLYIPIIKFYTAGIFASTFSLAFKVVIAGEVHGQPKYGIGSAIQLEKMNFNITGIFAWIVIIAIMSIFLDMLNKLILRKINRWKQ